MKEYILPFLLGIVFTITIAATTDSISVFKPARPVSVVVFHSDHYDEAVNNILVYSKNGYIVKQMITSGNSNGGSNDVLVVMEKY